MNISIRNKYSFVLTAILLIAQVNAMPDDKAMAQAYDQMTGALPNKLNYTLAKEAETLINGVNCTFGDLACLVQEDALSIKDKDKKSRLLQEITQTRRIIQQLLRELMNYPVKEQLDVTLQIVKAILKDLESSLNADFSNYKAFDLEALAKTRSIKITEGIDEEGLKTILHQTQEHYKSIQKKAEKVGLTLGNQFYRAFIDKPLIQPCAKYNLHGKTFYTLAVGAGLTYAWYRMNKSINGCSAADAGLPEGTDMNKYRSYTPEDPLWKRILGGAHDKINGLVRYSCGWPIANFDNLPTGSENIPRKWLSRIDQAGHDITYNRWAPFMSLLWVPYHDAVEKQYEKFKEKIARKALEWHYWAKGGAFYQQYKFNEHEFRVNPQFTFDDIIGNEHAKRILGDVIKYIQDPELYERAGLTPATGYILYGPTRTGKSMIAEALAGELKRAYGGTENDFPFYSINSHYLSDKHYFEMWLEYFKTKAPCIMFIDEIDLLNLTRTKGQQNALLSEFLAAISGCMNNAPDKKVILIVATNNPDDLDPALLARLPERIPFDYPSFMNRAEYMVRELEGKGLPLDQFDIKKLADQTDGCSYEQLHKVVNKAQFTARETGKPVTQLDIEQCINTELRHIIYHDYKTLSEDELNILSLHMVGHAMAYKLIESKSEQLSQVTIRPVKNRIKNSIKSGTHFDQDCHAIKYGHIFTNISGDSLKFLSKNDMKRKCMIELAGGVVETIVLENCFLSKQSCSEHDRTEALNWAKRYFLNGMDENTLANSKALQNKIAELSFNFVEECEKEVKALFEPHKDLIIFMADVLKKIETLNSEDITEMMNIHKNLNGRTLEEYFQDLMQKQQMAAQAQEAVQDPLSEITV
jgi:cell division protease FtsH